MMSNWVYTRLEKLTSVEERASEAGERPWVIPTERKGRGTWAWRVGAWWLQQNSIKKWERDYRRLGYGDWKGGGGLYILKWQELFDLSSCMNSYHLLSKICEKQKRWFATFSVAVFFKQKTFEKQFLIFQKQVFGLISVVRVQKQTPLSSRSFEDLLSQTLGKLASWSIICHLDT